jgi:RNA polymerase sigma-70 factor (ECF subfamily)
VKQDRLLLQRIAHGDEAALGELYRGYYPKVSRFVFSLVKNADCLGEIVNDVFLVVWQRADCYRGDANPSTWIFGIAYKKALKWSSRQRYHEPFEDNLPLGTPADTLTQLDDLERILRQLSVEQRAVVELTYWFGYSYKEIAEIVACPENTVKTRMYHARRKLQALERGAIG